MEEFLIKLDSRRKTYIFSDKEASIQTSTTFYYRLKMVDGDGTFKYSSIVSILLTDMTGRITIIPNPVTQGNEITLNFIAPANGIVKVKITDNFGRVMMQQVTPVNKGNNNLKLNIDKLPASTYYLHISGTGLEENVKVQKL
jgi:hypothetical protein